MAGTTMGFGAALILLGFGGWEATDRASWTALIPAILGVLLVVCGWLARHEGMRRHAMHTAAIVGLIGFLGPLRVLPKMPAALSGAPMEHRTAVLDQIVLMVMCGVFLALCIRSFVAARRARMA